MARLRLPPALVLAVVMIVASSACTKAPDPEAVGQGSSPTPVERPRVETLSIDEPPWNAEGSNWRLTLRWESPTGFEVDHYVVTRDGDAIDDQVETTRWIDRKVEPGVRFTYTVRAVSDDGTVSRAATASVKTGEPPVAEARLEGPFVMTMRVETATGTRDPVSGGAVIFRFEPRCRRGPCSVVWTVEDRQTEGNLQREGRAYAASVRTPFFITDCDGDVTDESIDILLEVTGAAPVRGAWRATRIEGVVEESSKTPGCFRASITWNVRGTARADASR